MGFCGDSVASSVSIMEFLDMLNFYEVLDKEHLVVHKMEA
jgi:hypothetical protein